MNKMKNKFLSYLIVLFFLLSNLIYSNASYDDYSFLSNYSNYDYYIKNMDVKVEVNDKREYKITETIDVHFNEYRHGIIRSIPKSSSLEQYKINDIVVGGSKYNIVNSSDIKIKIGDPDEMIIGDKQYTVEYTLAHYKDNEKDGDYLYLNVLGTQWDTYIENFTSTITYPEKFEILDLKITGGYYGSIGNDLVTYETGNNSLYIKSVDTISPKNGVTVNIRFNEGVFSNAPINIKDIVIPIFNILSVSLLVVTVITVVISRIKRRDMLSVVEFYPPEDLNSVELGYLYTNVVYDKNILSLIYCWANKGYLKIKLLDNNDFSLTKLKSMDETNDEYERELFNKIFSYSKGNPKVVTGTNLKYKLSSDVEDCKKEIINKIKSDKRYSKENKKYRVICLISYLLLFTSMFLDYNGDVLTFITLKMFTMTFLFVFLKSIINSNSDESKSIVKNLLSWDNLLEIIVIFISVSVLSITMSAEVSVAYSLFFENTTIVVICCVWSLIIGKFIILEKSEYEKEIYSRIIGFKEFIEVAEKDKLEMLLDEDPEYFYKILPYAQVLNITDKWIDKFELIAIPQSTYYDYGYIGSSTRGLRNLDSTLDRVGSTMIVKEPSSSSSEGGFSGGGCSGGGSGGGGGSSW